MKSTELSFTEGFFSTRGQNDNKFMAFDWLKAAREIKSRLEDHPDLVAEAGLQRDWDHTSGVIFKEGRPYLEDYTYLKSNWAVPTLILSWDDEEQEEIECYEIDSAYQSGTKWCEKSKAIFD